MTRDKILKDQIEYYRARAEEYDQWHLRQGRYDRGEDHRHAWFAELETVRAALNSARPSGRILELASGTGLWTKQLAKTAETLTAIDASPETIEINRMNVDDPNIRYVVANIFDWRPDETYDFVFFGFWLSHVPRDLFDNFWETLRCAVVPNGKVFFVDSLFTQDSTAKDHADIDRSGTVERKLNNGSVYTIVKEFYEPAELNNQLLSQGWQGHIHTTGEFFLYGCMRREKEASLH